MEHEFPAVPRQVTDLAPLSAAKAFDLKEACEPGLAAVRHNWAPFLLMQALAGGLVVSYYHSAALRSDTAWIAEIKSHGGPLLDVVSGCVSGGVLPQLAKVLTRRAKRIDRKFWSDTAFNALVYAVVALEIDYFYRLQTHVFGSGIDWVTLLKKNAFDLLVFSTVLSIPSALAMFEWRKVGYSLRRLSATLGTRFYSSKVVPALLPCWVYWFPMLFCVYALPANLQFPFSQLVEASWCILFIFIATLDEPAVQP